MASIQEITAGENALRTYVDATLEAEEKGWEEAFIPQYAFSKGAIAVINAADNGTQTAASRQANGALALKTQLNAAGVGGQVTAAQCSMAAAAVLTAVAAVRSRSGKHK